MAAIVTAAVTLSFAQVKWNQWQEAKQMKEEALQSMEATHHYREDINRQRIQAGMLPLPPLPTKKGN